MIVDSMIPVSIKEMKAEKEYDPKVLIKCTITASCPVEPPDGIMPSCGSSLEDGCEYLTNPEGQHIGVYCKDENQSVTNLCPGFSSGGGSGTGNGGSGARITTDSNAQEQL